MEELHRKKGSLQIKYNPHEDTIFWKTALCWKKNGGTLRQLFQGLQMGIPGAKVWVDLHSVGFRV